MAKRKRLSPIAALGEADVAPATVQAGRPPIADVAGDASAQAALSELADEFARARAEGRLIQALPLEAIEAGHLIRDRIAAADEELAALKASIAARGQQVPVEVTELGEGRYGLISGWRRLTALTQLLAETGDTAFGSVKAVLRQPETASDAYIAMVEENEIRVGLSHYERARVAARATEAGVFADVAVAVATLFAAASKAKRSKIMSFVDIYESLDGYLAYPAAIGERLGLKLSKLIETGNDGEIRQDLMLAAAANADEEIAALTRAVTRRAGELKPGKTPPEMAPGIRMARTRQGLVVSGPGVDGALEEALERFLRRYH